MLSTFAAVAEGMHISLKAEELFQLGPINVTNSMVYGLVTAAVMVVAMTWAARRISVKPAKGLAALFEIMTEYVTNMLTGSLGTRERAARFAPVFGFFFAFIMFNNLLGILPLVGPGISYHDTPLFRPYTADVNGTIAMSVIAILAVQYLSIKEQGGKRHLQHYFSDRPWNPINFFIGILEVFTEVTRVISLSLRLFLNTAVGEILIAVFTSMVLANGRTPLAVIPILMFEGLVAYIQAYVFTVLTSTYLGMAIAHAEHDQSHDEPSPGVLPSEHHPAHMPGEVEAGGMQGG